MTSPLATAEARLRAFRRDVLAGLSNARKTLPSRWLYDEQGSALFEEITALEEYYPTRTETALLAEIAPDIAAATKGCRRLVEYGAGSAIKTESLLRALNGIEAYTPIDIAAEFLAASTVRLRASFPDLSICPIVGDFMSPGGLDGLARDGGPNLGFFPGSTIGNLSEAEITRFLTSARKTLGADGQFLIGADLVKDTDILRAAYDDREGVTAAFNLNLLTRINRELGADIVLDQFAHEARWNGRHSRIEMHLRSLSDQTVTVAGNAFSFVAGETIHTENSRKFTPDTIARLSGRAGWQIKQLWTDPKDWFAVVLLT